MDIDEIRERFPILNEVCYLNNAVQGPLSDSSQRRMVDYIKTLDSLRTPVDSEEFRETFSRLICARTDEVALIPNTSTGLNVACDSLKYLKNDNVVVTDLEFPSVVYPWLRRKVGVDIRYVENVEGVIVLEDFEKLVDDETVAVVISHVEYSNGFRNNLKAIADIAHDHGAYLIVDAVQSVGALKVDVAKLDVDFLTASSYKWMLGPRGAGFLYVKRELIDELEPAYVGWASVKQDIFEDHGLWDNRRLDLDDRASRFEVGEASIVSLIGANESVNLLISIGTENIEQRILHLTKRLIEGLREANIKLNTPDVDEKRSGIVNFSVEEPARIANKLVSDGIIVSVRAGGIRVSPHFYNTEDEIDDFLEMLRKII